LISSIIPTYPLITIYFLLYSNTSKSTKFETFKILQNSIQPLGREQTKVTLVAYESEPFQLGEWDERPSEEQRADPIISQGYKFEFPRGQIAIGESFDVCVEGPGGHLDCKTLTSSPTRQPEEVIFSIDLILF